MCRQSCAHQGSSAAAGADCAVMAGMTYSKLFLTLEYTAEDIMCLQKTWLPRGGDLPDVPGWQVYKHRRTKGKKSGFATLVRKGITVQRHIANKFAQLLVLTVPGGSQLAVVNCYLPPGSGMRRKRLSDDVAYDAVSDLVVKVPHHNDLLLCGDLNARTGCLVPNLGPDSAAERCSTNTATCARGKWLIS